MPTLHDLHDAFAALEQKAPTELTLRLGSPSVQIQSLEPAPRLRGWGAPLASAAAVAVLALGSWAAISATDRHHGSSTGSPGSAAASQQQQPDGAGAPTSQKPTSLTLSFAMDPVAGYTFSPDTIGAGVQSQTVSSANGGRLGEVYVYLSGAFDQAAAAQHGQPIMIDGRPGFYGPIADPNAGSKATLDSVSWQYAPDSWAMVQLDFSSSTVTPDLAKAASLEVAQAVRTGVSSPAKLPFRLTYLPTGVYAVSANPTTSPTGGEIGLGDGRPASSTSTAGFSAPISIWVNDTNDPGLVLCPANDPTYTRFHLGAHTGCFSHDKVGGPTTVLSVELTRGYLEILLDSNHQGIYSDKQLLQIAAGVVPAANIDQTSTWFDANTVVPQ